MEDPPQHNNDGQTDSPTRLDEGPHSTVRSDVDNAIAKALNRVLRARLGDEVFTSRPAEEIPPPAETLRLALMATQASQELMRGCALRLRGEATPWEEIFPLLGVALHPDQDPAEAAYQWVSSGQTHGVLWTCNSCQRPIRDFGPAGNPTQREAGHADSCQRHRRETTGDRAGT